MTIAEAPLADAAEIRAAQEYYAAREWTDGLPVVPVTESYLKEFLGHTSRDPDEVLFEMPHLNRRLTVRLAALNAGLAGCLPEYFPVVLAAWDGMAEEPYPKRGIWQSTTGTAPMLLVNGPVRNAIGLNGKGNVFGSGFRANATIGRTIRLTAINVFGLRPHQLDQATQGTLAKYSACIAENEEESPWDPLHVEYGFAASDSAVAALVIRSGLHIEARHTQVPEQLGLDLADSIRRTGALIHEYSGALLVLNPEHAQMFDRAGWSKDDVRRFVFEHAVNDRAHLAAVGKDAVSRHTEWRLPADHPDSMPDQASKGSLPETVHALRSPSAVWVAVAGANNAGVSAVIETFGGLDKDPTIARVET